MSHATASQKTHADLDVRLVALGNLAVGLGLALQGAGKQRSGISNFRITDTETLSEELIEVSRRLRRLEKFGPQSTD